MALQAGGEKMREAYQEIELWGCTSWYIRMTAFSNSHLDKVDFQ